MTAAWDQFLQGANAALSELTAQDWVLASMMVLGPLITLAAGFALTMALFAFGQPLFAIPVGLSTLGLVIGMGLVATQFVGFSLGRALLPWAADLIVISLLTGHPLAALFIFWSVLNGARFIILDFPLLVIAGAAPVTMKAAALFLASAWIIAHLAALAAVTLLVVTKARLFLHITQPFRMTGLERAVIAATVAVITFVIVALFSSTVLGLIVVLAARNFTITGRSVLISTLRAVAIGGVVFPVVAAGVMLSLVRLLRFQLTMVPPVSIALVIILPLVQALFVHRRITRLLTASELGAVGSVLLPLVRFIVSVFGLAITTVRALIPALFSGTTALVTGLAAIPASIAFYASSVTWVLSNISSFTLIRRDIRPVVLVFGSVMALSALTGAAGLIASAPLLAPPLTVIAAGVAAAVGVVGAVIACFTAGQLSLFVTGLRGAAQLLLRLVVASTMITGLFFMSSGIFAGIGPFISALILRGVRLARTAVSAGLNSSRHYVLWPGCPDSVDSGCLCSSHRCCGVWARALVNTTSSLAVPWRDLSFLDSAHSWFLASGMELSHHRLLRPMVDLLDRLVPVSIWRMGRLADDGWAVYPGFCTPIRLGNKLHYRLGMDRSTLSCRRSTTYSRPLVSVYRHCLSGPLAMVRRRWYRHSHHHC